MLAVVYDAPSSTRSRRSRPPRPAPGEVRIRVDQVGRLRHRPAHPPRRLQRRVPADPRARAGRRRRPLGEGVDRFRSASRSRSTPTCTAALRLLPGRAPDPVRQPQGPRQQLPGLLRRVRHGPRRTWSSRSTGSTRTPPCSPSRRRAPCTAWRRWQLRPGSERAGLRRRPDRPAAGPADRQRRRGLGDGRRTDPVQAGHGRGTGHRPDRPDRPGRPGGQPAPSCARPRGGDGYDIVVEATGATDVGDMCVPLTRNGGTVMVYGVTRADEIVRVPPVRRVPARDHHQGLVRRDDLVRRRDRARCGPGRARTDGIITHRFSLDDYGKALDALANDRTVHKIVIAPRRRRASPTHHDQEVEEDT